MKTKKKSTKAKKVARPTQLRSKAARANIPRRYAALRPCWTPDQVSIHQGVWPEGTNDDLDSTCRSGRSSGEVSGRTRGEKQGVRPLCTFGHLVATPGAPAAIDKSGQQPGDFLARHVSGD